MTNVQLYDYYFFIYNKWNSLKYNFSNTSELIKLHHLSMFLVEDTLNSPAKWLQFYYYVIYL